MDYRKASVEDYTKRVDTLQDPRYKVSQDTVDAAICARNFLNLRRCGICLRLHNEGYICCHCAGDDSDGGDYDE